MELLEDYDSQSYIKSRTDKLFNIKSLAESKGGKELVDGLLNDKESLIKLITVNYLEFSPEQLLPYIARLDACCELIETINNSIEDYEKSNEELREIRESRETRE